MRPTRICEKLANSTFMDTTRFKYASGANQIVAPESLKKG
jgi:hypothetical protein